VVTVAKTSAATTEDISSATPITRTTVTEVAIAEAEVEEVETVVTETSLRELTARMDSSNNSKQFFPFLS
jgi:predicted transcriptional regulator